MGLDIRATALTAGHITAAALTHFHKIGIPTMKTFLTGAILAGLFAVGGCSQTV